MFLTKLQTTSPSSNDVIKTFFQDQDQDQDLNFKTKTKTKPSVQDQDQDFASQDQDQDLFVMNTRGRLKSIFIFDRKRKYRRKWNSIYGRKRKSTFIFVSAEKRKRKSPDNICVCFLFSYIQSPSQPYNAPLIPRPVSPFWRWSLLTGFHFPQPTLVLARELYSFRGQCIDIFVAFF